MNNLKEIRKEKGLTQNELSRESGVTQAMISKMEQGTMRMTAMQARKLAGPLGEKPEALQGRDRFRLALVNLSGDKSGANPDFLEALGAFLDGYLRNWNYKADANEIGKNEMKASYMEAKAEEEVRHAAKPSPDDMRILAGRIALGVVQALAAADPARICLFKEQASGLSLCVAPDTEKERLAGKEKATVGVRATSFEDRFIAAVKLVAGTAGMAAEGKGNRGRGRPPKSLLESVSRDIADFSRSGAESGNPKKKRKPAKEESNQME